LKFLFFWVFFYTLVMAISQILLKVGVGQIGGFHLGGIREVWLLVLQVLTNLSIMSSIILMVSSFFLWLYILSWTKLSLVFPLTALVYVLVPILSFLLLGERLSLYQYLGATFIASGVFFLLFK